MFFFFDSGGTQKKRKRKRLVVVSISFVRIYNKKMMEGSDILTLEETQFDFEVLTDDEDEKNSPKSTEKDSPQMVPQTPGRKGKEPAARKPASKRKSNTTNDVEIKEPSRKKNKSNGSGASGKDNSSSSDKDKAFLQLSIRDRMRMDKERYAGGMKSESFTLSNLYASIKNATSMCHSLPLFEFIQSMEVTVIEIHTVNGERQFVTNDGEEYMKLCVSEKDREEKYVQRGAKRWWKCNEEVYEELEKQLRALRRKGNPEAAVKLRLVGVWKMKVEDEGIPRTIAGPRLSVKTVL